YSAVRCISLGALSAPKAAFGALNATKATLGRLGAAGQLDWVNTPCGQLGGGSGARAGIVGGYE
ncbi:hypothetical protein AB0M71_09925, partial [Amycolatopsis sp. NPDC051114]|uniref:hypothetical protein n=1 Tax=Amycolatopsis sp. NPDC051114 TaxID=3155280 RepID=UPI00344AF31C